MTCIGLNVRLISDRCREETTSSRFETSWTISSTEDVVIFAIDEQNWSLDTRRSKVRSRDGEKLHDGDGPAAIEDVLDSSLVQVGNFVES